MKRLLMALAFAGACAMAQAKEITWTGAVNTDFANEGNWSGGAPAAGDTAKFAATATITGEFDFGADGLALDVARDMTLTCQTAFAGTGQLTKIGEGTLAFADYKTGTFTGGLRVEKGKLWPKNNTSWNLTIGDSANVVTLVMTGADDDPQIRGTWGSCLNNLVHVTGTCQPERSVFSISDVLFTLRGSYTADCDTLIASAWNSTIVGSGSVDVSGQRLTLKETGSANTITFGAKGKSIKGTIATTGAGMVKILGEGDAAATLIVSNRTSLLNSWTGSARVEGTDAVLTLGKSTENTVGSFSGGSTVTLADGGKLVLDEGTALSVKALTIDETPVEAGIHQISEFNGRIEGTGDVMVGCKMWCGGASGLLSAPDNWSDNKTPVCGDVLIFGQKVTLETEDFELTEGSGLSFQILGVGTVVTCNTDFSGAGGLTSGGQGALRFGRKANGTFTGGVRVVGGELSVINGDEKTWSCTIGDKASNVITLVMSGDSAKDPTIWFNNYSCGLNNKVVVVGTAAEGHETFAISDRGGQNGDVESETDVRFATHCGTRSLGMTGNIDAGANTVYAETNDKKGDVILFGECNTDNGNIIFDKTIFGSLTTRGQGHVEVFSSGVSADATLTVESETRLFNAWAGDVVVSGATLLMTKTNAWGKSTTSSLAPTAKVSIGNGGKLVLENGKDLSVASLTVNGVAVAKGIHTVAEFGGAIEGSCTVLVGCDKRWIGGAEGLLTDGANWSDNQPAKTGDLLVFEKNVKLIAPEDDALFNLGDGDLTFVVADGYTLTGEVKYEGTGRLVKLGKGTLKMVTGNTGTFSGGVRVEDGTFSAAVNGGWGTNIGNGRGVVEVAYGAGRTPQVKNSAYGARIRNPIRVTGENAPAGAYALSSNDRGGFLGAISADVDFAVIGGYYSSHFLGDLSAPGRTVTVNAGDSQFDDSGKTVRTCYLAGAIDASIVKIGAARLDIAVGTTNAANALTVTSGDFFFQKAAAWAGTNVVLRGETARLMVSSRQNLSRDAVVTVEDDAQLYLTNGITAKVAQLIVGGKPMPEGAYSAANLPDAISGEGRVRVGKFGQIVIMR